VVSVAEGLAASPSGCSGGFDGGEALDGGSSDHSRCFSDSKPWEHLVTTTLRLGGNQPFNGRRAYTPGQPY